MLDIGLSGSLFFIVDVLVHFLDSFEMSMDISLFSQFVLIAGVFVDDDLTAIFFGDVRSPHFPRFLVMFCSLRLPNLS